MIGNAAGEWCSCSIDDRGSETRATRFFVGADDDRGGPNVFAQALVENDLDSSHRLLGFGGAHAFDVQLRFERAAHFAYRFVVERRTVVTSSAKVPGAGGSGNFYVQVGGRCSQAGTIKKMGEKRRSKNEVSPTKRRR